MLPLDARPVVIALAGPNGAGKSTFYYTYLQPAGLRFVNADELASELTIGAYEAAAVADRLRRTLLDQRESFVFETVFSDPVGDKVSFLRSAADAGYNVVLCFIGIGGPEVSETRVAMRVLQGGHDVPSDKLATRFERTLANLHRAIRERLHVFVYDNSDLRSPYRFVAEFEEGRVVRRHRPAPKWLQT